MANTSQVLKTELSDVSIRKCAIADSPIVLTDIYRQDVNIAIWENQLSDDLISSVNQLMSDTSHLNVVMTVTPDTTFENLIEHSFALEEQTELCEYISVLVDMYCTLFELKRVGLRLTLLNRAMCPKFHVDKVPCRLVTTLSGVGTQWLPHDVVDRTKLGAGSSGLSDEESGIMRIPADIQRLKAGDVGLIKGEGWFNNEGAGLVHRSPALDNNQRRLLLTLDFVD